MIYGAYQIILIRKNLFYLPVAIQTIKCLPTGTDPDVSILSLIQCTYPLIPRGRSFCVYRDRRNFCQQLKLLLWKVDFVYSAACRCQPKNTVFIQQQMKEELIGKVVGKRFQLIDTGHFQFFPIEEQNFSTGGEEKHTLFTGILLFKVTDGILFGERKAMIAFVQRIIVRQCLITFLKPNFVILVIEYHSYFFPCDGER